MRTVFESERGSKNEENNDFSVWIDADSGGVAAQNGKMSWNFDTDKVGEIAKGFTNEAGKWEVVADDTAPSKPNVLAQLAKSSRSDVQPNACQRHELQRR